MEESEEYINNICNITIYTILQEELSYFVLKKDMEGLLNYGVE